MARLSATGDITVYVAPATGFTGGYWDTPVNPVTVGGNDATGDGSMGAPWATPQRAVDEYFRNWDFAGQFGLTIKVASAPAPGQFYYPGVQVSGPMLGQPSGVPPLVYGDGSPPFVIGQYKPISIVGAVGNQLGAFLNPGTGGRPAAIGLAVGPGAIVRLRGLSLDTTYAQQDCADVFGGGILDIADVIVGNASNNLQRIHFGAAWGGILVVNGDVAVAGNASSFVELGSAGTAYWNNNGNPASPMKVRILGTPQFSNGMFNTSSGQMTIGNVQFLKSSIGSDGGFVDLPGRAQVNGTVAVARTNGTINTGTGNGSVNAPVTANPDYFPQNIASGGTQISVEDNAVCR